MEGLSEEKLNELRIMSNSKNIQFVNLKKYVKSLTFKLILNDFIKIKIELRFLENQKKFIILV
jgi:hypothetical protein